MSGAASLTIKLGQAIRLLDEQDRTSSTMIDREGRVSSDGQIHGLVGYLSLGAFGATESTHCPVSRTCSWIAQDEALRMN